MKLLMRAALAVVLSSTTLCFADDAKIECHQALTKLKYQLLFSPRLAEVAPAPRGLPTN